MMLHENRPCQVSDKSVVGLYIFQLKKLDESVDGDDPSLVMVFPCVVCFRLMHEANLSCHLKGFHRVHFRPVHFRSVVSDRSLNLNQPTKITNQNCWKKNYQLQGAVSVTPWPFDNFWGLDLAFTSYQKRAIKTLNLALEELDALWIPVTKSWKLNERMCAGRCWSWGVVARKRFV